MNTKFIKLFFYIAVIVLFSFLRNSYVSAQESYLDKLLYPETSKTIFLALFSSFSLRPDKIHFSIMLIS